MQWWFRVGRRLFGKKNIPRIESVQVFEEQWVKWWSAAQPQWRETQTWPFERVNAAGLDWGQLLNGGKDGLFLVVVSLGWWVHAHDPSEDSELSEAIADVTWVLKSLVSYLAADAITGSESPPNTPSPTPRRKRHDSVKAGPPAKRIRS